MKISTAHLIKSARLDNRIEITGTLLTKLQRALLQALKDFAFVCDKYGFYYSLCGGTALGAVRHKGFIPWDDDIDVFMIRSDYNRLLEIFETELGDKYYIHSVETTPEYGMPTPRMMIKGTVLRTHESLSHVEAGVYIDLCILENAPDSYILRTIHGLGSLYYGLCVSCRRFYENSTALRELYADADDEVLKAINRKIFIGGLLKYRSLKKWAIKQARWDSLCKNTNSKYVVCPTGIKHYFGEIFLREMYCTTTRIRFENSEFRLIKDYDLALKRLYGDYMQLPSKDKREKHFVIEIKL